MNSYEQKQAARRERMAARADRLRDQAAADYRKADLREEVSGIPLGQPILVGHHSERRHRRALERADSAMRRAVEASKRADELERRAASPSGAISSDDPDAVAKLKKELAEREERHSARKARPHESWELSNSSANIRRIKARIAQLERNAGREHKETQHPSGVRVVENAEENRLQLLFPGKPSDAIRAELKSCGFRWSPNAGAWQRHLNNGARYAAECVLKAIAKAEG